MKTVIKKLLSVFLSTCLLSSSVTPAFAQLRQIPRGLQTGIRLSKETSRLLYNSATFGAGSAPWFSSSFTSSVAREAALSQLRTQIATPRVQSLLGSSDISRLPAAVLSLPQSSPQRAGLLRNEFVSSALLGNVTPDQRAQALAFYRADLAEKSPLLAQVPFKPLEEILQQTSPATLQTWQEALSSAAALAALGNAEDAPLLTAFWEQASQGGLGPVATAITGRGLLRFKAYDNFNLWSKASPRQGELWQGFSTYAVENKLPISFALQSGPQFRQPQGLAQWLQEGCAVNALNAYPGLGATRQWLSLGQEITSFSGESSSVEMPEVFPAVSISVAPTLELTAPQNGVSFSSSLTDAPSAPVVFSQPPDNSGMLYSGLPLFALVKKTANWFRGWKPFQRRAARKSAIEKERDLHVNTSEPIYTFAEPAQTIAADDFTGSVTEDEAVLSGVRGFKLTLEGADGTEEILRNVDVFLDATFETEGYNRVALSDGYVFQLRNLNHEPAELKRFFFELENDQGQLYTLLSVNPKKMTRALHIKLERKPNSRFSIVSLPVRLKGRGSSIVAYADVDTSLLPRGHSRDEGEILVKKDGSVLFVSPKISNPVELKDFYVRLPKKESKYWAPLMQSNPHVPFVLKVRPTLNKTSLLTMAVPSLQIGLGKTTAPELYSRTTLGESASSMVMLGINNVLPITMGIVRPMLKRYGEASVLRFSSGLFVAGGSVALASGLYGLLGDGLMSSLQLTGFITSSVLIALGTNVTRIVQNILISANRGEVVSKKAADDPFALQDKTRSISDYNRGYLWKRFKEVVTQRPTKAARDVVLFQTASMFKNVGTMTFLAFPWLANMAVKGIFGVDPGLDFSASYIPYTAYSLWVLHKLRRMAYKDAVPTQFSAVYGQFKEKISDVVTRLQGLSPEVLADPTSPAMQQAAKDLKNSIKALQDVENRQKKKLAQDLTATYEKECLDALKLALDRQGLAPVQTQRAVASLGQAFESLNPREANLWQVLRIPVIRNSVLGITLATMHELSVSNGFAFAMHGLLGNGTAANALTALALYGATCAGRILGNGLSRRVSEGSMYLVSSAFSLAGTMTMIAAGNHVAPLVAGAVIASFGVGNFFSQIYDYATAQRKEYKREISLLINYTMPAAAILSMPMRRLVGLTGFGGMDLVVSAAALIGSLALTPGMFANSSLRLYFKQGWKRQQGTLYRLFHLRHRTPPAAGGLGSAAQ